MLWPWAVNVFCTLHAWPEYVHYSVLSSMSPASETVTTCRSVSASAAASEQWRSCPVWNFCAGWRNQVSPISDDHAKMHGRAAVYAHCISVSGMSKTGSLRFDDKRAASHKPALTLGSCELPERCMQIGKRLPPGIRGSHHPVMWLWAESADAARCTL